MCQEKKPPYLCRSSILWQSHNYFQSSTNMNHQQPTDQLEHQQLLTLPPAQASQYEHAPSINR